ncbi:MAG: histidine kinase [Bacteroidales bacterium]|nr:histidine kinase [Bacteroidales bacterium]
MKLKIFQNRLLLHILFWVGYILLISLILTMGSKNANIIDYIIDYSINAPFYIGLTYLANYTIIPRFVRKQKYITMGILLMLSLVFFIFLIFVNDLFITTYFLPHHSAGQESIADFSFRFVMIYSIWLLLPWGMFTGSKYMQQQLLFEKQKLEIEKQHIESQLKLLKSQFNPHFIFNTLNNLYYLAIKNDEHTPDTVLKLSGMLRYIFDECSLPKSTVSKEADFINNYLGIEKLRNSKLQIHFEASGLTGYTQVPPLMFFPLIEKAINTLHGVNSFLNIKLTFEEQKNLVLFNFEAKYDERGLFDDFISSKEIQHWMQRMRTIYNTAFELNKEDHKGGSTIMLSVINE